MTLLSQRTLVLESTDKKYCCYVFTPDTTYDICTFTDDKGRACLFSSVTRNNITQANTTHYPNIDIAAEWAALHVIIALTNIEEGHPE